MKDATALIIVDVQNDFINGSLATDKDNSLAPRISDFVKAMEPFYAKIITTQDWHIDPGTHWAQDEDPNYSTTWPIHCAADTWGSEIESTLAETLNSLPSVVEKFYKGQYTAAYSGFEAHNEEGLLLGTYLRENFIDNVDIIGIATDFCVKETVVDAVVAGLETVVLADYVQGVDPEISKYLLEHNFDTQATVLNTRKGEK